MNFFNRFNDDKSIEIHQYQFKVKNVKNININLLDGIFEHAIIMVKDPHNIVRILFSFKSRFRSRFLSTEEIHTTNGAISGPILDGIWTLTIIKPSKRVKGKYQIEIRFDREITLNDSNQYLTLKNNFYNETSNVPNNSWVNTELHSHSYYSDGRVSLDEIKETINHKIDLYALTDHTMFTTKFPSGNYLFLPGSELTFDNEFHYNLYGCKELIDFTKYFEGKKTITEVLEHCFKDLSKKYLLSINHPFAAEITRHHHFNIKYFNLLEVINAPYAIDEFIDNEKAIRFFDYLWNHGYQLFGVGGSDAHKKNFHNTYPVGIPLTKLFLPESNISSALNSLKNGRVYLLNQVNARAKYEKNGKEVLPGSKNIESITCKGYSQELLTWRVIIDGKCIDQQITKNYNKVYQIKAGSYLRLEARKKGEIAVFVNPISNHLKVNEHDADIADLLSDFEKNELR